jgi:biotin carboxyl carrier protein
VTGRRRWPLLAALGIVACSAKSGGVQRGEAAPPEEGHLASLGSEVAVVLDSATVRNIGLETTLLATASRPAETELPAEAIVDPQAVSLVRAPVAGRLREMPGVSWPGFGSRVSRGATLGQVSDALPLTAPRGGTVSRVAALPGELVEAGQELLEITDYDHPLVRLAWPSGGPPPTAELWVGLAGGSERRRADLLGPAAEADPLTRGLAYLYRLHSTWPQLRPGATLVAVVLQHPVAGAVFVPDRAVVQWDGLAWVYLERQPGRFVRVRLDTRHPVRGGWLDAGGLKPGNRVVTTGAGQLLSEEFRARIVVGEEVGE